MAINGRIVLEELVVEFTGVELDRCQVRVTGDHSSSEFYCDSKDFTKALAIAVHHTGMPDWQADYEAAERAQPAQPGLRFIP